jgi:hypothetical protein
MSATASCVLRIRKHACPIKSGNQKICAFRFSDCGFPVNDLFSFLSLLPGAQLDIHSTAATQLGCVERSSPEAAKRCAAGAELDGDEAYRATLVRAVIGVPFLGRSSYCRR